MAETKICPNCETINEKLDLEETQGVYICSKCKKLIDAKKNEVVAEDEAEKKNHKYLPP